MSNIKISNLKSSEEAYLLLTRNIPRYIKYLNEHLLKFCPSGLSIAKYDSEFFNYINDSEFYYYMRISSQDFLSSSVNNILNGPISEIFKLEGIADIKIINSNTIELIYYVPYFLSVNLFNSFNAIDKFKL